MRSSGFAAAAAAVCCLAFMRSVALAGTVTDQPRELEVLSYDIDAASTTFSLPCEQYTGCSLIAAGADESLVFHLQINPVDDPYTTSDIVLNGQRVDIPWHDNITNSSSLLTVEDSSSGVHGVNLTVFGSVFSPDSIQGRENVTQFLSFNITSIDQRATEGVGFYLTTQPTSPHRLRTLLRMRQTRFVDFADFDESFGTGFGVVKGSKDDAMHDFPDDEATFDLAAEVESLSLLESAAEDLQSQITAKKQSISAHLKQHRDHVSLKHLLAECDGLICAAKVVAQRVCDKIGVKTIPSFDSTTAQNPHFQHLLSFSDESEKPQQTSRNCTKSKAFKAGHGLSSNRTGRAQAASLQLFQTKNGTANEYKLMDLDDEPNLLVRAIGIIAALLGLAALFKFIRRKCMSMRKRVERAADREERRNARAYRRAARRAEMRRRWDSIVNTVTCFRAAAEPRCEDYEEKRALILQDAFLEQLEDMENAAKGEIMEAEIRELRHAQEIVASLVRVDEHRFDLVDMANDPPPPLVPLPYTPETRSRASTNTLPSYTSETLPDYSSQPETLSSGSSRGSVVDGFTRYTPSPSHDEVQHHPPPPSSSTSSTGRTRYTPTSSIVDVSPRVSAETLRTRQSKDTQDL